MCDYSLCGLPTRLAVEGEQLLIHRFPTRTLGLASPMELKAAAEKAAWPRGGLWARISNWFSSDSDRQAPAVCIPPGARLLFRDIPERLQQNLNVGAEDEVTFVQLNAEAYQYRDAIRFANGEEILLQKLDLGQPADVLCLSPTEEREPSTLVLAK